MTYCASLRELLTQARRARRIILDLSHEDSRTLRLIETALRRYPGAVAVETRGFKGSFASRKLNRIEARKVFWCPALAYELRQILPEECVLIETESDAEG
jgi:hypothetical protein